MPIWSMVVQWHQVRVIASQNVEFAQVLMLLDKLSQSSIKGKDGESIVAMSAQEYV